MLGLAVGLPARCQWSFLNRQIAAKSGGPCTLGKKNKGRGGRLGGGGGGHLVVVGGRGVGGKSR